ncbi:hypothetical protein GA0074696_2787 [Micromonospora purpureochromogenes]|uniref:DUF6493 domain-containing protein n=1 Tax=Micromonospora purpureochromogenes TaxID=47872 RepID=A0A1C4XR63_9ACTN|nr:DUF6493 family protein [Micromonospora purpureochromogenes]SCF10999.1 hypothetical protein GA0074696_2787 [Micromonospora purpureochromogenes]
MNDVWRDVCARIDDADFDALAGVLAGLDATGRAALLPMLEGHTPTRAEPEPVVRPPVEPEPEPEPPTNGVFAFAFVLSRDDDPPPRDLEGLRAYAGRQRLRERESRWARDKWHLERQAAQAADRLTERRHAALAMAIVACVPTATEAVRRLHRPWTAGPSLRVVPEVVPALLSVRGAAWGTALARGMVRRAGSRSRMTPWPFTEALMRAVGTEPPDTPGAVARYVETWRPSLASFLAADPWLDHVLPYLFDEDRVAAVFVTGVARRDWPQALMELASSGRVDREVLIAGCLRRLRAGGRKGLLQPYLDMLKQLAPGTDELARHRQELTGLLTAPMSTVADYAYTSLQTLHRTSELDRATLAEITQGMLSRQEKKLVRAHLAWLRTLPLEHLVDGLVVGLHHPVPELAERTVDLIEARLPKLSDASRGRLAAEVPSLDGVAGQRLAALLGSAPPAPASVPALVAEPPVEMPPPLDLGAVAGELAILLRRGDDDPIRHELVLDGLVRAAGADRDAAARVLEPLIPQWPGLWPGLVAAAIGRDAPPHPAYHWQYRTEQHPMTLFVTRRVAELTARLVTAPPVALLATPATVAGHVDPARVLGLLVEAERDGWQPGEADLAQAILRLPREVDPAVRAAAARLVSPAGRRFAGWLATPAEPRTWVEEVRHHPYVSGRRIAMLDPAGLPAELADPRSAAERVRSARNARDVALWPMVAPSHREAMAAHIQPFVASIVDQGNPGTGFLAGLAAADGPAGPAMSLTMAYALANHRQTARLAAGDALIELATRPGWDSTGVGAEVGALAAADRIVLQRIVQPLAEALKAGARDAVWQVTSAALPVLLPAGPRPGLADLVDLAANAAPRDGHSADLPGLAALAARPGRNRLTEAARRLAASMTT